MTKRNFVKGQSGAFENSMLVSRAGAPGLAANGISFTVMQAQAID